MVNPLEVKFKLEKPTHYVPAHKRREIYDYMQKSSIGVAVDKNKYEQASKSIETSPEEPSRFLSPKDVYTNSKKEYL